MATNPSEPLVIGKITSVYGVKGWVKIHSYTEPMENFFSYSEWLLKRNGQLTPIVFEEWKRHGKGLIALIDGVYDRDLAASYCKFDVAVSAKELAELESGDYYWHQLEGLRVYSQYGDQPPCLLGVVSYLFETGANDVMTVKPCDGSIDQQERLIPYMPDLYVKQVDLDQGQMTVDWDPEF